MKGKDLCLNICIGGGGGRDLNFSTIIRSTQVVKIFISLDRQHRLDFTLLSPFLLLQILTNAPIHHKALLIFNSF